ncbi:hypothetical protein GTX53_24375 [Streptomyces sp. SID5594]|uniref:DUF6221 family protein n=1 Tax=unclassified Streptomyces TaxID=2593676 RepID=UPI00037453D2|nr:MULTISPECIES: DUF6221 family protein [unclassified Streptomyces]MZF56929.1 hypothetical protein [Streptomyces sp. SID5594]
MDDLVQFLRNRLAEDAAIAQAAASTEGGGTWEAASENGTPWVSGRAQSGEYAVPIVIEFEYGNPDDHQRAAHIARHDPARVLREIDAKRSLLELAERAGDYHETFVNGFAAALESTLRLHAVAYTDHPDYRGTWRP